MLIGRQGGRWLLFWLLAVPGAFPGPAQAVPSFARQTGLPCSGCHTVFPQLTPSGREFKLTGYTMTNTKKAQTARLQEDLSAPLSLMLQVSATFLDKKQPGTQSDTVLFPDEMSLFYAGRISDKAGTFLQITYDGVEDHFSFDNADLRFASRRNNLIFGMTLNNNPTVQDPWNSTPAWGYPFAASKITPSPAAAALIDGELAQQVAGLGLYGFWNKTLYAEAAFYRASQIGQPQPADATSTDTVDGNAPYWRLVYEGNWGEHHFAIGGYGIEAELFPTGVAGPTDRYRDTAADAQYQYIADDHTLTLRTTLIEEKQTLDASFPTAAANASYKLKTFRMDAAYYAQRTYGGTLAYFSTTGDRDALRYAPAAVTGSRTGKPDTRGWIGELAYLPWANTKFALQYTRYEKFNGAGSNYDGFGRDASDNSTVLLNAWLNF